MRIYHVAMTLSGLVCCAYTQQIINGQIFTPGIVVIDSPQPNTPMGGDTLHIALDVTSNGQLTLPPYGDDPISAIYNITIFLSSSATFKNFTITNGTETPLGEALGNIMAQEDGSTVKHLNWKWPDCLVGDGVPKGATGDDSARGEYNISIHQNFRLNDTDQYTIFNLPIQVTNMIAEGLDRPPCELLENPLLDDADLISSTSSFARIPGTGIESKDDDGKDEGLGNAGILGQERGAHWIWVCVLGSLLWI